MRAPGSGRTLVRGLICCFHQSLQIQWSLLWGLKGISCNSCSVGHLSIRPVSALQGPRRRGAPIEWSWAQGPSGERASPWPLAMFIRFVQAPFRGRSLVIRIVGVPSRRFRFQCPLLLGHRDVELRVGAGSCFPSGGEDQERETRDQSRAVLHFRREGVVSIGRMIGICEVSLQGGGCDLD